MSALPPLPDIVVRANRHYDREGLADAVRAYGEACAAAGAAAERERVGKLLSAIREHWAANNGKDSISVGALDQIAEVIADGSYVKDAPAAVSGAEPVAWRYRATNPSMQWVSAWAFADTSVKPAKMGPGSWELQPLYTTPLAASASATEPVAPAAALREALLGIVDAYKMWRRRGALPAPEQYDQLVMAIERGDAALAASAQPAAEVSR